MQSDKELSRERFETTLTGLEISPGLGMGRAWIAGDVLKSGVDDRRIESREIEQELGRMHTAFDQTRQELDEYAGRIEEQLNSKVAGIFRAHGMMLESFLSSGECEQEVRGGLVNAEAAVKRVFRRWHEKFQSLKGETFRQRADDVSDLGRRVLRHLKGQDGSQFKNLPAGSVLVVERLLPSDLVSLSRRNVAAIVVEALGRGSHAALLAREKGIPAVAGFPGILEHIQQGDELLVDGYRGTIVVSPDPSTRAEFHERLDQYGATLIRCKGGCHAPAHTLDRVLVQVEGNIGAYDDVELALESGADGIGLLRIEQLYLGREAPPTDEELLADLRRVTLPLRDKPVTIRLLDIGGDKPVPFLRFPGEINPALGMRGVRLLLEYSQLTRTQLAALLRLSQEQSIRILVPMVTIEEDIQALRELFEATLADLGIGKRPRFGAMIETPAAALCVPAIAKHVDFLSVGTNDLTQYMLAAGRDEPAVDRYYLDSHSSILRLLGIIIGDAGQTPVTLCGELAGKEEVIPKLLRIGFRSLSMAPPLIPAAKELIRSLHIQRTAG
jgi:phosphoenolpyruvate-protein phosphotransferase